MICRELGDKVRGAGGLEGLAAVAAAQGQPAQSARLFGAVEALREATGAPEHHGQERCNTKEIGLITRLPEMCSCRNPRIVA